MPLLGLIKNIPKDPIVAQPTFLNARILSGINTEKDYGK